MAKPGFDPSDAVDFWDLVNRQDWAICESVQRGMTSRVFQTGYYAPMESWSLDIRRYIGERLGTTRSVRCEDDRRPIVKTDFEYIVLGLGGFGSAAAYWLARRAGDRGARAGAVRAGPRAGRVAGPLPDHPALLPHAGLRRAGQARLPRLGASWSATRASRWCSRPAGSTSGPRESAIPLSNYSDSMDAAGVPYERLDAGEIMRRWPQWRLTDDMHGLFQEQSGIAMAARGNAAHVRMAREHGATLLRPHAGRGDPPGRRRGRGAHRGRDLPLPAAGDHRRRLVQPGARLGRLQLPLTVTKEQVTYFASPNPADFQPDRFPIWIWMDDPCFYGFPDLRRGRPQGGAGRGRAGDTRRHPHLRARPARRSTGWSASSSGTSRARWARSSTPRPASTPSRPTATSCSTSLPEHPEIAVAIGGGHGFKFASLVGRILVRALHRRRTRRAISRRSGSTARSCR